MSESKTNQCKSPKDKPFMYKYRDPSPKSDFWKYYLGCDKWDWHDWRQLELNLPSHIKRTRKRPNVAGIDAVYVEKINGTIKGKTCYLPGLTKTGKPKTANYCGNLVESITFGRTHSMFEPERGEMDRQANKLYPQLYLNLKFLAHRKFPDFKYNQITLNHNLECKPHKDGRNVGESIIVGFGEYSGGELNIEGKKHNIRYKLLKFNGALHEHWVEPFEGERWTAIFFWKKP